MGIGSVLQNLIQLRGTNVNAISSSTGVNPQTIYSIIKRDSTKADIGDLYKIATHLGVDLNYFYKEYDISVIENKQPAANEGDELLENLNRDEKRLVLAKWISTLNPEQLERVEKLLDAALLSPRE